MGLFFAGTSSSADMVEVLHFQHTMVKNIRYHLNACLYLSSACSFLFFFCSPYHFEVLFIIIIFIDNYYITKFASMIYKKR